MRMCFKRLMLIWKVLFLLWIIYFYDVVLKPFLKDNFPNGIAKDLKKQVEYAVVHGNQEYEKRFPNGINVAMKEKISDAFNSLQETYNEYFPDGVAREVKEKIYGAIERGETEYEKYFPDGISEELKTQMSRAIQTTIIQYNKKFPDGLINKLKFGKTTETPLKKIEHQVIQLGRSNEKIEKEENVVNPAKNSNLKFEKAKHYDEFLDPRLISFTLNNETKCSSTPSINYIFVIYSSPPMFHKRNIIRSTWAQENLFKGIESRTVFILGKSSDSLMQRKIGHESKAYGDIIQPNFDQYSKEKHDKTKLTVAMLQWLLESCLHADYIIKINDDSFVDIFRLKEYLKQTFEKPFLIGKINENIPVLRPTENCKGDCISFEEFPNEKYPTFVSGVLFIMSSDMITMLYDECLKSPLFKVEEVYTTGLLTRSIKNLHRIDIKGKFCDNDEAYLSQYRSELKFERCLTIVHHSGDQTTKMWFQTLSHASDDQKNLLRNDSFMLHLKKAVMRNH